MNSIVLMMEYYWKKRDYGAGMIFSGAAKRVYVYLVVSDKKLAEIAPIKSYFGGNDIQSSLFQHEEGEVIGLSMKLLLIADRRESLSILDDNGVSTGIFICPDIYASYLSRKIVQEIKPIERSHEVN